MACTFVTQRQIFVYFTKQRAGIKFLATITVIVCFFASSYAGADEVVLVGGDVICGKITEQNDLGIVLDHNDLGRLEIPRDRIISVTLVPFKIGERREPSTEVETETQWQTEAKITEESVWFEPELKKLDSTALKLKEKGWSLSADFSLTSSSGNTKEQTLRIGSNIQRNLPDRGMAMDFSYYNKTSEGSVTDNKFSSGFLRDWLFPDSRMFYFATARYDYDEFESWLHRVSADAGPGFHLIKKDDLQLDLRLGAGPRKEYGSENNNIKFEGLGQLDLEWKMSKKQTINVTSSIFPVISDYSDFRTRTTANWRILLSKEMNLSFLVGLLHEYQAVVDPDKKKNDTRVHTGIQIKF